jgi:hypothetical protein
MASRTTAQHDRLLAELNEERLAALTRISKTLETQIDQLHNLRQRILQRPAPAPARDLNAYRDLRASARKYRWYLEVQREALGIRHHRVLDEFFAIPEALEPDLSST